MSDIFTMIVGLLAAVGATVLVRMLAGRLLRTNGVTAPVYAVLRADSGPDVLLRTVRQIDWLRGWGMTDLRVIVAGEALPPETRAVIDSLRRADPTLALWENGEVWGTLGNL
ncbi:MAG: hypothetical protein LBT60_02455 [Oscillospiraceae bacterium]|jgi:hypothetical protein|nr:hypothetical protein [Oscillospiraceae bacterium]